MEKLEFITLIALLVAAVFVIAVVLLALGRWPPTHLRTFKDPPGTWRTIGPPVRPLGPVTVPTGGLPIEQLRARLKRIRELRVDPPAITVVHFMVARPGGFETLCGATHGKEPAVMVKVYRPGPGRVHSWEFEEEPPALEKQCPACRAVLSWIDAADLPS